MNSALAFDAKEFEEKLAEYKSTEIGADMTKGKFGSKSQFIPPYETIEPMKEMAEWCEEDYFSELSSKMQFYINLSMKSDVLNIAPPSIIGSNGNLNAFIERSGGSDAIYPYIQGDAAYLIKPSSFSVPVIKKLSKDIVDGPSGKKVLKIVKNYAETATKPEVQALFLCVQTDIVVGMMGGNVRSRDIFKNTANIVKQNTKLSINKTLNNAVLGSQ